MNVGCCIVPSKGNRCITHDIVAIIIAFPPVSVDVGRPFGAPVEWSSRPSGKGYNKGVTVIFDIVGKNVLTLYARWTKMGDNQYYWPPPPPRKQLFWFLPGPSHLGLFVCPKMFFSGPIQSVCQVMFEVFDF